MLFVCIMLLFFPIDFCKCFLFSCFVFVYFIFFICIMHSAFNLFVFHNSMFTSLLLFSFFFKYIFYERAMSSPEKQHLKIIIIIIIIIVVMTEVLPKNSRFCVSKSVFLSGWLPVVFGILIFMKLLEAFQSM